MGVKQIIGIAMGALAGFLIGYFGRCVGGIAWGLTSNPWSGMIVGALVGFLVTRH
jgi:hypothetical protein